ncbi:MAG: haloacid dehalogenase-like hydrolase [Candidatus Aenigmatarchaeota archaeon]
MNYKTIVSDWNGTIFYDATDEEIHKEFAYELLRSSAKSVIASTRESFETFIKVINSGRKIMKKYKEYNKTRARKDIEANEKIKRMKEIANEIYEIFNSNILIGRTEEFVDRVIENYAKRNKDRIDRRVLNPIRNAHSKGKGTFIISGSYQKCIKRILDLSNYISAFDEIIGTKIREYCGIVTNVDEASRKRKRDLFIQKFFNELGLRENDIIYLGDCEFDLEIGEMLPEGNFIVPFLATDEFKELASRYCKAFVPESESDLAMYLEAKR